MSERNELFTVDEAPRIAIRLGSGDVRLVQGGEGAIEVTARGKSLEDLTIEQRGNTVVVEQVGSRRMSRKVSVLATVPETVEVDTKLGSADLAIDATVAELRVATGSGDVKVDRVDGSVSVASGSGDVALGAVAGRLQMSLASGDLSVEDVGDDVDAKTASGDVRIGRAAGRVVVRTASGDLDLHRFEGEEITSQSMSGDLRIGLPPGRTLDVDIQTLSGSVRNEFGMTEGGTPLSGSATLRVKTLSGDVVLRSAR